MVDIPLGSSIKTQSNSTISSIDVPATVTDFEGPTVLLSPKAEPNTEAPAEDTSNLELGNETTTPQTEEKLPFIDADIQSENSGSYVGRDIDFGKHIL